MDWTTIITALISLIGGGGIVSLFTLPSLRKKAIAEAEKSIVDNYETYANRMEERQRILEEKLTRIEQQNKIQYECIMTAFSCQLLAKNPNSVCPVKVAYAESKSHFEDDAK